MRGFHIKRCVNGDVAVHDGDGARLTGPLCFEAALAQLAAIEAAECARREKDPLALNRRRDKAAYRLVDRNPYLKALKNFLPGKGDIERHTRASNARSLKFVGTHMSIVASDPAVHAELNKSPDEQRVTKARQANKQRGDERRAQVAERWNTLADLPEHKRSARIAHDLGIDVRHVRRLRPQEIASKRKNGHFVGAIDSLPHPRIYPISCLPVVRSRK